MNLLLLEPAEIASGSPVTVRGERARHLREVLRVVPGQAVRAGVIDGPLGAVTVVEVHPDRVQLDAGAGDDADRLLRQPERPSSTIAAR